MSVVIGESGGVNIGRDGYGWQQDSAEVRAMKHGDGGNGEFPHPSTRSGLNFSSFPLKYNYVAPIIGGK